MQSGSVLHAMPVLQDGTGTVAFQLKATHSNHEEVLDVEVRWGCPFSAQRLLLWSLYVQSVLLSWYCNACRPVSGCRCGFLVNAVPALLLHS